MPRRTAIEVVKASTHNLKAVSCRVPHGKVTVVTGPSGAGKSSLAFDTIFAEGQRRFVESMSTYARQFLQQMERPPVEELRNVLPPVALEARNAVRNARSTVGTITETYDVLRLLYTHIGEVHCPNGHGPAAAVTPEEAAAELAGGVVGERFVLVAPVARPKKNADAALRELVRQGFARRLDGGEVVRMGSSVRWLKRLDPMPFVLGRFQAGADQEGRVSAAVEEGYRLAAGRVVARGEAGERHYARRLSCRVCGEGLRQPVPALFSFNSPLGACPACQGFGRVIGIDRERVVPDPGWTLEERPIAPWNTPAYEEHYEPLYEACRRARACRSTWPGPTCPRRTGDWIWSGKGDFVNLDRFFAWLERRSYKVHVRVMLARYRAYDPCPDCDGTRLQPEALAVRVEGETLPAAGGALESSCCAPGCGARAVERRASARWPAT